MRPGADARREAILLQVCEAGIVFLPGAGGTVQEIFQDGCGNFYAEPESVAWTRWRLRTGQPIPEAAERADAGAVDGVAPTAA